MGNWGKGYEKLEINKKRQDCWESVSFKNLELGERACLEGLRRKKMWCLRTLGTETFCF